jgi:hypothetical protein
MTQLVRKHKKQILSRARKCEPFGVVAYCISPGDHTNTCLRKWRLPLRGPCHIVQTSVLTEDRRNRERVAVPCRGYRAAITQTGAQVYLGGDAENRFCYDLGYPVFAGARGRCFDPYASEGRQRLLQLLLEMDRCRMRALSGGYCLPALHQADLPDVELGFAEGHLPPPEYSAAFVQKVLTDNGRVVPEDYAEYDEARRKLLLSDMAPAVIEEAWHNCFSAPYQAGTEEDPASGDPTNRTGRWLISTKFCSRSDSSCGNFENVSRLIGAEIYNPVRRAFPVHGETDLPNPAYSVARALQLNLLEVTDASDVERLVRGMREALGASLSDILTDDQILDILGRPRQPIHFTGPVNPDIFPDALLAKAMRNVLEPRYAECCEDEDLVKAARNPTQRLWAAGLARVQLCAAPYLSSAFQFRRAGATVDFWSTQTWSSK